MMPIEWPDIDAFVRNSGISLCAWEIEVIEDLDDLFLASGPPKLED
nr:MAG TPA: INTERFERON-BETA, HELICAL CYTOKINE, IMMUNE SYSTEM [Caudoviricetes sp.]